MKHSGISDAAIAKRKAMIVRHIIAGYALPEIATNFGLSLRYIRMLAAQHGLAKPVGRPVGWRKPVRAVPMKPERSGYTMQAMECGQ